MDFSFFWLSLNLNMHILLGCYQLAYNCFVWVTGSPLEKRKPPSLVSLCLGIIGKHLEDIIEDLDLVASFPPDIKVGIMILLFHTYVCEYPFDAQDCTK